MRGPIALALLVSGCRSLLGFDEPSLVEADAADPDAPGTVCLGSGEFRVCVPTPSQPFSISQPTVLDTDASPACLLVEQGARTSSCVIAATTISIDTNVLFGTGMRPLVLFAVETIRIASGVDVGSHGQVLGAGASSLDCGMVGNGEADAGGGGGGAGGSFGSRGGDGGNGAQGNGVGGTGAEAVATPPFLRGGCPGGSGGNGTAAGGAGNNGGGALLLLAGTSITITGFLNASGGGGFPGLVQNGGGGGGGSGGTIAMDAPTIVVDMGARFLANGGGGGGGAGTTPPDAGADPDPTTPTTPAVGGIAANGGGSGGDGAAGVMAASAGVNTNDGGGGGGGGVGQIRVLSGQALAGTSSPPAIQQ